MGDAHIREERRDLLTGKHVESVTALERSVAYAAARIDASDSPKDAYTLARGLGPRIIV